MLWPRTRRGVVVVVMVVVVLLVELQRQAHPTPRNKQRD